MALRRKDTTKFTATYRPGAMANLDNEDEGFDDLHERHDDDESSETHQHNRRASHVGTEDEEDGLPPPTSINAVRANASKNRMAAYLKSFDDEAQEESRAFCSLPASMVDDSARAQLLAAGIDKENEVMQHQNSLLHLDMLRRNRLVELEEKRRLRREDQQTNLNNIQMMRQQTNELVEMYYHHAHRELDIHLTSRQGEVSQSIGEIRKFRRGDYDPDVPDWSQIDQQVKVEIMRIRGIKDKVPKGNYTVLVSKWDKMGGFPIKWCNRKVTDKPPPPCPLHFEVKNMDVKKACEVCNGWAGATTINEYKSHPKDYDMTFNSAMETFFAAQVNIRPYNVLVFELVHLPKKKSNDLHLGGATIRPQVVGWSVIPIVDSNFEVVNGKFRVPLIRGPYKPRFGKFGDIHDEINKDLENWLGNIFVDIYPHAREHFGRKEFDLQRDTNLKLLNLSRYPAATSKIGWPSDRTRRGASIDGTENAVDLANQASMFTQEALMSMEDNMNAEAGVDDFPYRRPAFVQEQENPALTHWNIIRTAVIDRKRTKEREANAAQRAAVKKLELQKRFRFAIHPFGATQLQSIWRIQVEYCIRAILDELSLRQPTSIKFWANIITFAVIFYAHLFFHGIWQYAALHATFTPIFKVDPKPYGLLVTYSDRQTYQIEELAIGLFSMFSSYFLLLMIVFVGWLIKRASGSIPEQTSKFVFLTALTAFMIPWVEMIIDGATGLRRSDFFRLEIWFNRQGYGWYYVYICFILMYAVVITGTVVSVFLYTMKLHLNGILQDAYWRIMLANEDTCHIPEDLELSVVELQHILYKAERWRGVNGERRKTNVSKLETTDENFPDYRRLDLHIVVFQLACGNRDEYFSLGGLGHIYRQFFVLEDGAILEAIDDGTAPVGVGFTLHDLDKQRKQQQKNLKMEMTRQQTFDFGQEQSESNYFGAAGAYDTRRGSQGVPGRRVSNTTGPRRDSEAPAALASPFSGAGGGKRARQATFAEEAL